MLPCLASVLGMPLGWLLWCETAHNAPSVTRPLSEEPFNHSFWSCFKPDTRSSRVCPSSSSTPRWWCQLPAPPCSPVVSPETLPWCSQHHWHGPEWIPRKFYVSNPTLISPTLELLDELHSPSFSSLKCEIFMNTRGGQRISVAPLHPTSFPSYSWCASSHPHLFFPSVCSGAHRQLYQDGGWIF